MLDAFILKLSISGLVNNQLFDPPMRTKLYTQPSGNKVIHTQMRTCAYSTESIHTQMRTYTFSNEDMCILN